MTDNQENNDAVQLTHEIMARLTLHEYLLEEIISLGILNQGHDDPVVFARAWQEQILDKSRNMYASTTANPLDPSVDAIMILFRQMMESFAQKVVSQVDYTYAKKKS